MADEAKEVTVTISLPPRILLMHWECYTDARQQYIQQREEAGKLASSAIADYFGALALIKDGYVHIEGVDELARMVSETTQKGDQSGTPMEIIGFLVREVARKVERAFALPLDLKKQPSGTVLTQSDTPVLPS